MKRFQKKLLLGLFIMALVSPLGIILPQVFKSGGAWGEWGTEALEKLLGYVPEGLRKSIGIWKAPVADYGFGGDNASLTTQMISYIISGFLGIIIVGLIVYLIARFVIRHGR